MRPIDGDKLIETYCEENCGSRRCRDAMDRCVFVDHVRAQPTIEAEPVRHGRWEHLGGDEWRCTECGNVITTEGSWEKPTLKFCDECGAKMDGGNQNE